MEKEQHPNQLIHEKSPYLLQHAYNPVQWYPWGEEAFSKARRENKPVFLSIGYSTCHWCHVMSEESFEDEEVAELLNGSFVAVKVDKEERPDIDAIYMAVCQSFTGQGGWPLTIMITPEQKPFYAATYLPKHSKYNVLGLTELLQAVEQNWKTNRDRLIRSGEDVSAILKEQYESVNNRAEPSKELIKKAMGIFHRNFDKDYGGFGTVPKFPMPHNLMLMLRYYAHSKDGRILEMAEKTLQQMYRGGIFDHIGSGFSRYSTDRFWLVPHFEKMLYDNALLTMAYLDAYQLTQKSFYRDVAERILHYVERELTSEEGGFYSAQDADSGGVEGSYYLLTPEEIHAVLGEKDGAYFNESYGITAEGNFEGKNIPNLIHNEQFENDPPELLPLREKLLKYRKSRTALHKDDKILTAWNAMMIGAFAKAYQILAKEEYLNRAQTALSFLESKLTAEDGSLYIRCREGEAKGQGLLDDYAYTAWACHALYEATLQDEFLQKSITLCEKMIAEFWDMENGGFYLSPKDGETLICRPKELYDGAVPSGNSVAAYVLLKLSQLTGRGELEEFADQQLRFMAAAAAEDPTGYGFYLIAVAYALYPSREVVCVLKSPEEREKIRETLRSFFLPNTSILVKNGELAPYTREYPLHNGETTFYVCENKTCSAPFHGVDTLKIKLQEGAQ